MVKYQTLKIQPVDDHYKPLLRAIVTGYQDDVVGCYCCLAVGALEMPVPGQTGTGSHQVSVGAGQHLQQAAVDSSPWGFPLQEVGVIHHYYWPPMMSYLAAPCWHEAERDGYHAQQRWDSLPGA